MKVVGVKHRRATKLIVRVYASRSWRQAIGQRRFKLVEFATVIAAEPSKKVSSKQPMSMMLW